MQYVFLIYASAPIKIHPILANIRSEKEQSWQKSLGFKSTVPKRKIFFPPMLAPSVFTLLENI